MVIAVDRASLRLSPDNDAWGGAGFITQLRVLSARSLRTAFGDYRLVFFGLLQPVVILLLFSQVFAGIGDMPGVVAYDGYINYLMPATLVMIAMTTAMASGAALLSEIYSGWVGRLRTMPINLVAVLAARTVSDAVRLTVQLVVASAAGVFALGFKPGGMAGMAAAIAVAVAVGWGLSWLFIAIATWQSKPELMQAASFVVMFPLMFGSSAYVPLDAMPTWIRVLSTVNPLTYAIDATRALAVGMPVGGELVAALALAAVAAVLGGSVATRTFRAR
ncbi:ABC transporter permease [Haloechinothrix salitolerans]|uniref:Transport permease protein n=1 Tax=Haloechinothrix salitolerans TaxID=926830 RepID=A0ABW2C8C0_9PSEU